MISSLATLYGVRAASGIESVNATYQKQEQSDTTTSTTAAGDTVELSMRSELSMIGDFKLPTLETVRELSTQLSSDLGTLFRHYGIPSQPPVDITYDHKTDTVKVTGNRSDTGRIEKLLNGSDKLKEQIGNVSAVSGMAYRIQESLKFQREYRASSNPQAVVAKYSHLFDSNWKPSVALRYGGTIDVVVGGKVWNDLNNVEEDLIAELITRDENTEPVEAPDDTV